VSIEYQYFAGVISSKGQVQMVVSAPPNMAPSDIMGKIKIRGEIKLFEELPK